MVYDLCKWVERSGTRHGKDPFWCMPNLSQPFHSCLSLRQNSGGQSSVLVHLCAACVYSCSNPLPGFYHLSSLSTEQFTSLVSRSQHCCPLTLWRSHSQHRFASSLVLHQEKEELIIQGPYFTPVVIQDWAHSQSHVDMGTSHAAVGCQGSRAKGPTLSTVPVQQVPVLTEQVDVTHTTPSRPKQTAGASQ